MPAERDFLDRGRLSCYICCYIVTKPLLRHRVEQTGVSVILRRYGAAGREWLERLFLRKENLHACSMVACRFDRCG